MWGACWPHTRAVPSAYSVCQAAAESSTTSRRGCLPAAQYRLQLVAALTRLPLLRQVQKERAQSFNARRRTTIGRAPLSPTAARTRSHHPAVAGAPIELTFESTYDVGLCGHVDAQAHAVVCMSCTGAPAERIARDRCTTTRTAAGVLRGDGGTA